MIINFTVSILSSVFLKDQKIKLNFDFILQFVFQKLNIRGGQMKGFGM